MAMLASAPALAMRFEAVNDTLVLSGPVVDGDLARLRDALQDKSLRQVLLHQSPGGDSWTGQRLGLEIRQAGLNTLLSGQCASACGYMFLGGVQRRLTDDKFPQALMQQTVNSPQAQDFMEFALTPRMLMQGQPRGVFQCLIGADQRRNCQELPGYSALNTGVVTHAEIVKLDPALRSRLPP